MRRASLSGILFRLDSWILEAMRPGNQGEVMRHPKGSMRRDEAAAHACGH